MSYLNLGEDPTFAYFGYDSGMGWPAIGEPAPAPAPPAFPAPVFRDNCDVTGCAPAAAGQCRNIIRLAARDAIRLCIIAANRLDARHAPTVTHFRRIFGHHPDRPVPWANNRPSGETVAHRLRKVAEALHRRVVHFRCTCPAGTPVTRNAQITDAERNVIQLCNRFWARPDLPPLSNRFYRAGVILHEMLHLLYRGFFYHHGQHPSGDPERHRDNSHCYEAFVLLANGHTPEPGDITACAARPF